MSTHVDSVTVAKRSGGNLVEVQMFHFQVKSEGSSVVSVTTCGSRQIEQVRGLSYIIDEVGSVNCVLKLST